LRNNKTGIEVVWAENIRLQGKIRIDVDNIYSSLYNAGFCPKRGTHVTLNTKPIKIGIVAGRKTTLLENIKCLAGNTSAWKRLVLWGS
jgi:hypothetical protein